MIKYILVLLCFIAGTANAEPYPIVPASVIRVHDGNTFTATVFPYPLISIIAKVLVLQIDTPEIIGKCPLERQLALEARDFVRNLILNKKVTLEIFGYDSYGRISADVTTPDGKSLRELLLDTGLAVEWDPNNKEDWCAY